VKERGDGYQVSVGSEMPVEGDDRREGSRRARAARRGAGTWVAIGFVVSSALVVLIAQNTDAVEIEWLWWEARIPLAVLLLATGLFASGLTVLVGTIWRRRRRRRIRHQDALQRSAAHDRDTGPEGISPAP